MTSDPIIAKISHLPYGRTVYFFDDIVPTITVIDMLGGGNYEIRCPAFRENLSNRESRFNHTIGIYKDEAAKKYILDTTPSNVPPGTLKLPDILPPHIITFILTSNLSSPLISPFIAQVSYTINLSDKQGTATLFINPQALQLTIASATSQNLLSINPSISRTTNLRPTSFNTVSKINSIMNNISNYISTSTTTPFGINYTIKNTNTTTMPRPHVNISALNTTNGLEVSEIAVRISDTMTYSLCNKKLSQSLSSSITSTLEIYHTEFSTVILGCGCTFIEKLISLVGGDYQVYIPIVVYTILKYVIALLIYGDLNVKYLYRSHNNQFLCDLKDSRFSNFYEVFTVPNPPFFDFTETDKYFIWSENEDYNCIKYNNFHRIGNQTL